MIHISPFIIIYSVSGKSGKAPLYSCVWHSDFCISMKNFDLYPWSWHNGVNLRLKFAGPFTLTRAGFSLSAMYSPYDIFKVVGILSLKFPFYVLFATTR